MEYIWNTSTGLYPSIYFKLDHPPKEERERNIKMRIHETLRIKAKYSPHNATIFPYSKNQDGPIHLFSKVRKLYSNPIIFFQMDALYF